MAEPSPADSTIMPSAEELADAHARIQGRVLRTPVLHSQSIDAACGAHVEFKCENFQRTGAFKLRGATNAVMSLDEQKLARGVATHSSGNHAAALAFAARARNARATVVMPSNSSEAKKRAVRAYGARIVECAPTQAAREASLAEVVAEHGCEPVPPFDDPRVIAGQATVARELLEQVNNIDAVIAPVGGGGLLAGTAATVHHLAPHVRVYGGEPANADDACRSLHAGRRIALEAPPQTVADGLRTSIGTITFPIIAAGVRDIFTAEEDAIIAAMRLIWERMKIIVEPSAAVALAALMAQRETFAGQRIVLIISGGNVDLDRLPW